MDGRLVRPTGSPTKAPWRLCYLSSHHIVICLKHGFGATPQGEGGRVGTGSASHRCSPRASPSSPSSLAWLSLPAARLQSRGGGSQRSQAGRRSSSLLITASSSILSHRLQAATDPPLLSSSRSSLCPAGERLYGYDNCLQSTTNLKSLGGFGSWVSTIARQG
jgi:hypothetical protein